MDATPNTGGTGLAYETGMRKPSSLGAHDVEGGGHAVAPRSAHGRCSVPVLSAVILAAYVAAAGAVAPSEEWAERFRLLEARFEQSEASLHERVAFLEGERPGAATAAEQGARRGHGASRGHCAEGVGEHGGRRVNWGFKPEAVLWSLKHFGEIG